MNQYYTWSNLDESISYTGLLIAETATHISLQTKFGEMMIPKGDGIVLLSSKEEYDAIEIPSEPIPDVKTGSRTQTAAEIIASMGSFEKTLIIAALVQQMVITKSNANIYYNKIVG